MIPEKWRRGEVAVVGLARSGLAAARWLTSQDVKVYASDISETSELRSRVQQLDADLVAVDLGYHDISRIGQASAVVVSPGIDPDAACVRVARENDVEVIAELELAARAMHDTKLVIVTGTNGKTTTVALAGSILSTGGLDSSVAGNIGRPLIELASGNSIPDWVVVEASSFQLHDCHELAPVVGVLTNLFPDHLDRYADLDSYYADKKRIFQNADSQSIWILNGDQPAVTDLAARAPGDRLSWSLVGRADAWYDRVGKQLMLGEAKLVERRDVQLLGDHNVANCLAAALTGQAAGVARDNIAEAIAGFAPLPHRLELVGTIGGVLWINDSKATNVASTRVAFESMDRPFVALVGGRHKGEPYDPLAQAGGTMCKAVVTFGEASGVVLEDLGAVMRVTVAGNFNEAFEAARDLSEPDGIVLLSPACSSFDMFENYEQRGERFRDLVLNQ